MQVPLDIRSLVRLGGARGVNNRPHECSDREGLDASPDGPWFRRNRVECTATDSWPQSRQASPPPVSPAHAGRTVLRRCRPLDGVGVT
jgi:hypothetical protein